ncbi:MAG: CoA pyrophosphatase [Pirellulales bacterium]
MTADQASAERPSQFDDLQSFLVERLRMPLPGRTAQSRFEPELSFGRHYAPPPADARQAAVLVLLYPHADRWHVPLTLRPATMTDHAGQVSFPGGLIEPGETSEQAALRELEEELGIGAADVALLGRLTPLYLFVSNFAVEPWVAVASSRPAFRPNPSEVADVLELSLDHLIDPANFGAHKLNVRSLEFHAPHLLLGEHRIWGATSMMLGELADVVGPWLEVARG